MAAPKSEYVLRIVYVPTGETVEWAPGQHVEARIVEELCSRVEAKGVGVGCSTAHVVEDVRAALLELLLDLKKLV